MSVTMNRHPSNPGNSLKSLIPLILFAAFIPLSLAAGGSTEVNNFETIPQIDPVSLEGRKMKIVATTSFIGDVLSEIAGDHTEITTLMPAGQNPHSREPGPSDIAAIEDADLIFINGFGLEEEFLRILEGMKTAPVVPVSVGIVPISHEDEAEDEDEHGDDEGDDGHDHGDEDPHVWLSPLNIIVWAENIAQVLSSADPDNQAGYNSAAESYITMLEQLDNEIHSMVSVLDPPERKMVVDHVSFDYYAREYGFDIVANLLSSLNDQAEPSAREIAVLSDLIRRTDIDVIFVGGTAGRGLKALAESVAAESGRNLPVVELLSGSLGPAGERGERYPDFIRYNTELIVDALSGG